MIDHEPGHVPSFRALGLPPGYGDCLACGQRVTKEDLAVGICPGTPTNQGETNHG